MNDYISRQEALIAIQNLYPGMPFLPSVRKDWREKNDSFIRCEEAIIKLSAADAQPVRHGKWEKRWHSVFKEDLPCCSVCHSFMAFRWDYCPNCGAHMDEGSE